MKMNINKFSFKKCAAAHKKRLAWLKINSNLVAFKLRVEVCMYINTLHRCKLEDINNY